jgi:hypothetical protein
MPSSSDTDAAALANGHPPTYSRNMDRRLIVLETRFDTILPTLATKADLVGLKIELKDEIGGLRTEMRAMHGELKADMERMRGDMQRWMIVTLFSFFAGFGGLLIASLTRWHLG